MDARYVSFRIKQSLFSIFRQSVPYGFTKRARLPFTDSLTRYFMFRLTDQLIEQLPETDLRPDHRGELGDSHPFLLHRIAIPDSDGPIFQRLVIDRYTERSACAEQHHNHRNDRVHRLPEGACTRCRSDTAAESRRPERAYKLPQHMDTQALTQVA